MGGCGVGVVDHWECDFLEEVDVDQGEDYEDGVFDAYEAGCGEDYEYC